MTKKKKKTPPKKLEHPVVVAQESTKALVKKTGQKGVVALVKRAPEGILKLSDVETDSSYKEVAAIVRWTKDTLSAAEKEKLGLTKDSRATVKKVNALYKECAATYVEIQDHGTGLMRRYDRKKEAEHQAKAKAEADKVREEEGPDSQFADDLEDMAMIPAPASPVAGTGLGKRKYWHAEVVDLNKVLLAFIEDNAVCKGLRRDLGVWLATKLSSTARSVKSVDIGVPGAVGKEEIGYSKNGD